MTDTNFEIAQRIRAARLQRELTQQDIAEKLGKTSAAISDLERGKTQVSASDLVTIYLLLGKPIEYFYGEDFSGNEIEDINELIRRLPPKTRKQQLPLMMMMLRMFEIGEELSASESENEQEKLAKEFYDLFVLYYISISKMLSQLQEIKLNLESALGLKSTTDEANLIN